MRDSLIQYADFRSGPESVIERAPPAVRRRINEARIARGLSPVFTAAELEARLAGRATDKVAPPAGPGVWTNGPRGSLVPAAASRITSGTVQRNQDYGPVVERVLVVPVYGDACPQNVRHPIHETVDRGAFGSADELNKYGGWSLQDGHEGPILATAGERLRAIDTPAGLGSGIIIEWLPDDSAAHRAIVEEIDRGRSAVSVAMAIASARIDKYGRLTRSIAQARLLHVAILPADHTPAYPGARCKVFRNGRRDDAAALRKQIDELLERAAWYDRQAKRR